MLRVNIVAVGSLKDRWLRDGCDEYLKRLRPNCRIKVVELPEAYLPERASQAEISAALDKEGDKILEQAMGSILIALCVEGEQVTSEQLSGRIGRWAAAGQSTLTFVIGSSYGLSPSVKQSAAWLLSLSRMTLPHQLARLVLCEQLYRALSIASGGKYHK